MSSLVRVVLFVIDNQILINEIIDWFIILIKQSLQEIELLIATKYSGF